MKKLHLHRVTKPILDLLRQEIFAVLAVAALCLVVVVIYTQKSGMTLSPLMGGGAINPSTGGNAPGTSSWLPGWSGADIATNLSSSAWLAENSLNANTNLGDALWDDEATIYFGSTIKGYNREGIETWTTETGVQNRGGYLQIIRDNQVTIAGVNNGNSTLWVTGKGTMTINGTAFAFRTLSTLHKVVGITNGTMTIKFKAGAQIYTISTLSPDTDIPAADETITPAKVLMIPSRSTITLNKGTAMFRPIVILTDQAGKQITNTAGLLTWTVDNENIATISNNGVVTATKPGNVTITVAVANTNLTASIYLTVKSAELSPLIDVTPKQ